MPPTRTNEIIDLCSSPGSPPSPIRVRTRSQSRARSIGPNERAESSRARDLKAPDSGRNASTGVNATGRKGLGKQPMRPLGPVIELTDSEDEKDTPIPSGSRDTHRREQNRLSSSSGVASGSGNASFHREPDTRNIVPDPNGESSRSSVPDPGKGKGREILINEDMNVGGSDLVEDLLYDPQQVVKDADAINPPVAQDPEPRQPPIADPSNQPAAVAAPLPEPVDPLIPPEPEVPITDPPTQTLARILEVVPTVDPEFLYPLIATHLPNFGDDPMRTAEYILGGIFEMGDKVPKIKGKAKRKSEGGDAGSSRGEGKDQDGNEFERKAKKPKVDWASVDRPFTGTGRYLELALIYLQTSFPYIPKRYLRRRLDFHNCHYAPTHLALAAEEKAQKKAYEPKVTRYNPEKDRSKLAAWKDPVLEEERTWILEKIQDSEDKQDKGKGKAKAVDTDDPELEDGEGIECQCCFCEYSFSKMVQCPEAHLFCMSCISQYASTQLGSHCAILVCMHPSECRQPFPESELRRVLDSKLMDLYDRVKQQKEIEDACLEDLEECPFCEWKCVIEASKEEEKLFRCGNEEGGCGVVSCRMCKKEDHLPKSCKEVEDDKHLDNQHVIEEAMTQALMRQCPKCKKPFIKDAGCNKMSCPHCRTLSCYVCRHIIKGYDHFDQTPPSAPSGSRKSGKCPLWDPVEQRHADEVKAAAEKALADFKKNNPDADSSAIKIDIPKAPPPPAGPGGIHYHAFNPNLNNHFNIAAMNAHQARIQAQAAGAWGAGMHMPAIGAQPPAMFPVPGVLPPAPVPAQRPVPLRGPALIAQARRTGANRRQGADPDGPRIAHHAMNVRADPAPIPRRRLGEILPVDPPGPGLQNVLPQFHFGLAAPADAGRLPQQALYAGNANFDVQQQQRLREAFDVNERLRGNEMARQRMVDDFNDRALRPNEWRAGVRAATMMQQQAMNVGEPLRMYQPERQGGVGVGGLAGGEGLPGMGYNAGLGMPMVPRDFLGAQRQAGK